MTSAFHRLAVFLFAAVVALSSYKATAETNSPAAILQELREFNTFGTVLMVAAHPDDEDRPLLAFLSKSRDFRTGYLSINRGDGGQNEIGPEFDAKLGVIRTQELLAATGCRLMARGNFSPARLISAYPRAWRRRSASGIIRPCSGMSCASSALSGPM